VNLPTQLVNPDSETTAYQYDALGRRTKITNANTTTANFTYNSMSRLTKLENKKSDSSIISSYEYSYDNFGNRTQMIEANGDKTTWEYNTRYELLRDKKIDSGLQTIYNNSYSYDNVGNRLTKTDKDSNTTNYTYNSNNRLTAAGSVTYGYDDNGNQTSKTEGGNTTNYSYNYENKLTTITYPSGDRSTYKYYGDGKRYEVQSSTASTAVRYVYDGANILYEYETTGSTVARYTFGLGIDEPIKIYVVADFQSAWYHFDGLGSVTKMTNSSQGVINSYTYDAWGEQVSRTVTLAQPFTYTSREYDSTADLYFYRARWYDYKVGRFVSEDPIGESEGVNLYGYVGNNPVNFNDPLGFLNPEGASFLGIGYTKENYEEIVKGLSEAIRIKEPTIPQDKIPERANAIAKEMSLKEALKLRDLKEKKDEKAMEKLIKDIDNRVQKKEQKKKKSCEKK